MSDFFDTTFERCPICRRRYPVCDGGPPCGCWQEDEWEDEAEEEDNTGG